MLSGGRGEAAYIDEVMPQKLALELRYVEKASFGSDLGILLKTAGMVLRRPFAA